VTVIEISITGTVIHFNRILFKGHPPSDGGVSRRLITCNGLWIKNLKLFVSRRMNVTITVDP